MSTLSFTAVLLASGLALQAASSSPLAPGTTSERVGRSGTNRTVLPVNQVVTPLGLQVDLPGLRPQVLALSPDGRRLVVSGKTAELLVLDPVGGARIAELLDLVYNTPPALAERIRQIVK